MKRYLALAAALLTGGCALSGQRPAAPPQPTQAQAQRQPVTIIVSLDGFRPGYVDPAHATHLAALAARGLSAAMRPAFPSKTFPNHYTLVTGLTPDHHGIVGNKMIDPRRPGERFTMANAESYWWDTAEPVWIAAERAGLRTAIDSWPAVATEFGGVRPSDWTDYAKGVTPAQHADRVLDWLRRPAATRPRLIASYIELTDNVGHSDGPGAPGTLAAVTLVDAAVGRIVAGAAALGQPIDLIVVSDHGMAATSPDRVIALDRWVDPALFDVVEDGVYAAIVPHPGQLDAVATALVGRHPHLDCWRRQDIPARFRYGRNPRVAPVFCLAQTGWLVYARALAKPPEPGNHGYDNDDPAMRALFVAAGPAFAIPRRLPTFDNVDIAPLLRDLVGLPADPRSDGDDRPFRGLVTGR